MAKSPHDPADAQPVITGLGMVTAVGHCAAQAVTSLRAGVMRLGEFAGYEPVIRNPGMQLPEPATAAPVAGVTDGLQGIERLLALGVPALEEVIADARLEPRDLKRTGLIVVGGQHPAHAPGSRLAEVLAPRLAQRVSQGGLARVSYRAGGTAGVLLAVGEAVEMLRRGVCDQCVVGGVESWLDAETLAWLDDRRRLKSVSNPDGFIPGEAAAFLVIERASAARARAARVYAALGEVATAREQHTIWTETPCTASALTTCLRAALAEQSQGDGPPAVALCDLNGESYRSSEWAYAQVKSFRDGSPVPPVIHPADCIGDVGAATGGVLLAMAAYALGQGLVDWQSALVWCSADDGERAAVTVRRVRDSRTANRVSEPRE